MEIVKILLIAIGGYGANYMKELTEKNVTNAKIEGICEVMPGIEKRFPIINRLEKGERLEQIAIKCGFGSQRTFLRIFKQYEGITPTQYREMKEKEETNA